MKTWWALVAAVLVVASCAGPSRTDEDYANKAAQTAQAMASLLETASLAADASAGGDLFPTFTSVLMSEMEDDASGVSTAFLTRQPPGEKADRIRADLAPLLEDAEAVLADLRIAAFRNQPDELARIAHEIEPVLDGLQRIEELTAT